MSLFFFKILLLNYKITFRKVSDTEKSGHCRPFQKKTKITPLTRVATKILFENLKNKPPPYFSLKICYKTYINIFIYKKIYICLQYQIKTK